MTTSQKIVTFLLVASWWSPAGAQDLKARLKDAYDRLNSKTTPEKIAACEDLNALANANPKDWAANYYGAYGDAVVSQNLHDKKQQDAYLDKADELVERIGAINQNLDESCVIIAYVNFSRFLVDPPNRWKTYPAIVNNYLDKAKKSNPSNPRVYLLQGIPLFYKPKIAGGGKEKARPYFEKAAGFFAKQETGSILNPYWGAGENADYLKKCSL